VSQHFVLLFGSTFVSVLRLTDGLIVQKLKLDSASRKGSHSLTDSPVAGSPVAGAAKVGRRQLLRLEGTVISRQWRKRYFSLVGQSLLVFKNDFVCGSFFFFVLSFSL